MSVSKGQIFYQLGFSNEFFLILCKFIDNLLLNLTEIKEELDENYLENVDFQTYSEQCEIIYNILLPLSEQLKLYLSSETFEEEKANRETLSQNFSTILNSVFTLINLVYQNILTNRYFTTFNADGTFENNENFNSDNGSRYIYLYQVSLKQQKRIFHHFIDEINQTFLFLMTDLNSLKKWNNQSGTCLNTLIETTIKTELIQAVKNLLVITNSIRDIFEYIVTIDYPTSEFYVNLAVFENGQLISGDLVTFLTYSSNFTLVIDSIFTSLAV